MTPVTSVVARASLVALLAASVTALAVAAEEAQHAAPPPVLAARAPAPPAPGGGLPLATTEYSHGDPSDLEQLFLELMNRARLDPSGEGDRVLLDYGNSDVRAAVDFFLGQRPGVEYTRDENHDAFDALPAAPPLAFNAPLAAAADGHSVVMRTVDLQTHQAVGELHLTQRVTAQGYDWSGLGESIFAFAKSMVHAHAGFAVDWGQPLDGESGRPETGHRDSLMNAGFVECGIGVITDDDVDTDVGPLLITIDFAIPQDTATRFVTGVVYDDRNGNSFYDPGEGIPGVRVETDASQFFALSSASGGYAVPVPADAGEVVVLAGGQVGTPGEVVGTQQVDVVVAGGNVKVDFLPLPEPPLPSVFALEGGSQLALGDGATLLDTVVVGELSADDARVGDIDVRVRFDHDERAEARITLTSPSGTEVVLFDGAPGGRDLRGEFDTTLRPVDALAAFVGEPYQGTWTLRLDETAGGVAGGTLEGWTLRVRPGWVRPLHAAATPLAVKALKVKDSLRPGKDKIVLKAELDAGGNILDVEADTALRLLDAATGEVFLALAIPGPFDEPPAEGPAVKAKVDLNRNGSSRGAVVVKISGLDLPGPPPAVVRVELAVGGAIMAEDVTFVGGKSTGVPGRRFFVDSIASKTKGAARSSLVKGRLAPGGALGAVEGTVEVTVGSARFTLDAGELASKGSKLVYKGSVGLRKLVVDPVKGVFSAKVEGDHAIVDDDDVTPVAVRLGGAFYGATEVRPVANGTKTSY